MRKITKEAAAAFLAAVQFSKDNTAVKIDPDSGAAKMYLHGNLIALKHQDGTTLVSTAGWNTRTTRERLNGLPSVSVRTRGGVLYLNGSEWDGNTKQI